MELAFKTISIGEHTGYGNASKSLVEALQGRGIKISPDSAIRLNFCMPPDYDAGEWTIGYTPWESTKVPLNWTLPMKGVDDLWTTAKWVAETFEDITERKDIFVLPHGIDPIWKEGDNKVRTAKPNGPFTFLHVGEPAVRKGGDLFYNAWYKAFRHRKDVSIIIKSVGPAWCRAKDSRGHILSSPTSEAANNPRVKTYEHVATQEWMRDLYMSANCLVYPSRGEGFGLIPLEAMATGRPVIIPGQGIGDFTEHAAATLVKSEWVESKDQRVHPGAWMDHDLDELIYLMEMMISNYETYRHFQYNQRQAIFEKFDWDVIGRRAVERILLTLP